jgi:pentatricopeptide repeat protein
MAQEDVRLARGVELACRLAKTGKFEDAAAVAREMIAQGCADEARSLGGPGLSVVIDHVCSSGRERDAPAWRQHHVGRS